VQPLSTPSSYHRLIVLIYFEWRGELVKYMDFISFRSGPLRLNTLLGASESESASDPNIKI
jgi:hypothetical protein